MDEIQQSNCARHWGPVTVFVFAILLQLELVTTANILMVHPVVSRSHELVFITLGEELASRGHNVTLVRFKGRLRLPIKSIRVVNLELRPGDRQVPYVNDDGEVEPPHQLLWSRKRNIFFVPLDIGVPVSVACESLFDANTVSEVFGGTRYDVAIVDLLFNECGLAFVHRAGLPVVAYWASIQVGGELYYTTSVMAPAIVPAMMTDYTDSMHFWQRFVNTFIHLGARLFATFVMVNPMQSVIAKHLPESPHAAELIHNISMLFINSDFALDFPRPISPNTVYIGCIQCRPARKLPTELEEFMRSSGEHGVIVFSLGATFDEGGIPLSVVEVFFEAFGRLKQNVILKMSKSAQRVILPANVKIVEWLPQQDILGHPKTRLMITHCGMHGVLEGIYHAVPMVGIPLFADQGDVLARMKTKGIVVGIEKEDLTVYSLLEAVDKVLHDKSYRENVAKLSTVLRDNPQSAMERAVFWIEYVVRHRGADHLKTSDRHLSLVQYLLLDVLAVAVVLLLLAALMLKWLLRGIFCKTPIRVTNGKKKNR